MKWDLKIELIYMIKVIIGISILITVCGLALLLSNMKFSHSKVIDISLFSLFFIALFAGVYIIYKKMDELQQKMHENSSVFTVTALLSLLGILGVLQAYHIIPLFNQFWILGAIIVIWGVSLSFYDESYK